MINKKQHDIDITRNIKIIEWLKSQLLLDVANLFKTIATGVKEEIKESILEAISNIIIIAYVLGKRLGLDFCQIDKQIDKKLKINISENHEIEKYYYGFSQLSNHIIKVKNKNEKI